MPPTKLSRRWPAYLTTFVAATAAGVIRARMADNKDQTLNPLTFGRFHIVSKESVSSNSSIFQLLPWSTKSAAVWQEQWKKGVWSISIKQPQLQIARDYTPLPPLPSSPATQPDVTANDSALNLWIRREVRGEMSNYLHALPLDSQVEIRGPQLEYELPDQISRIVFLAGGTGIAPALQVAHALQMRRNSKTEINIFWANRSRADCVGGVSDGVSHAITKDTPWWKFWGGNRESGVQPIPVEDTTQAGAIVNMLSQLKQRSGGLLKVDYFVDDEKTLIMPQHVSDLVQKQPVKSVEDRPGKNLIIISGPDGFVNFWAGPKLWSNGHARQGPLQGVLGRMRLSGWEVVKL
ncbi:hypothetical protein MBLNU457_7255t1 [Dothideomycetes sp. NU457]